MNSVPEPAPLTAARPAEAPPVALTRTNRGWSVVSTAGVQDAADLVEGLSLADLVAEEFGALVEPDRTARRSARGPNADLDGADPADARVAALERTVAQLEHALAARVSTERAIGVLAERHGTTARLAFESLRGDARSQGRPVADLAREVLETLSGETTGDAAGSTPPAPPAPPAGRSVPAPAGRRRGSVVTPVPPQAPRVASRPRTDTGTRSAAADGRS
jgi:hypothetical protein